METLARLQARLSSLHEFQELVGALRALAASRVQEAHGALGAIRRYANEIEGAIASGATLLDGKVDRDAPPSVAEGDAVLLGICSEHGFVGAYNERVLERVEAERHDGEALVIVGRRGVALAEERGLEVNCSLPMATHVGGAPNTARAVAEQLARCASARTVSASYRRGGDYEIETTTILPLDPSLLTRAARPPPLHHLKPAVLLEQLAAEYLFAQLAHAVMEALTSENGARLQVMEATDRNIDDKLETLRSSERAMRQEAITSELLDVVTGAEAILGQGAD